MTSIWQPGQLLYVGFQGHHLSKEMETLIRQGRIGGVILFSRNIRDPKQLRELTEELHGYAPPQAPLLIAIDQEGGPVQRLRSPWTQWPAMRQLGDRDSIEDTKAVAQSLAKELRDMGMDINFAPVVDVDSNPKNPVIGERSFSQDATVVARHSAAFISALQQAGIAACAKHFPGHGDTHTDSHYELPCVEHGLARLRAVEFLPFRAAISADVASIMTAHILLPQLDRKRPATMSPEIIGILREELAYDGVVFSDDLEMRAVADHFSVEQRVRGCLEASVDGLLVCSDESLAFEVLRLLEKSADGLVEHGLRRMVELKRRLSDSRVKIMPLNKNEEYQGDMEDSPHLPPYPDHQVLAKRIGIS